VKKQLLSPCLLAMFVAIGTRLVGVTLPGPVLAFTASLAVASKPLALLALGILFGTAWQSLSDDVFQISMLEFECIL